MAVSAKSKSRVILVEEPVADSGMNDNNPGMHPGHELSDLRNVPRQPAAEVSIHYARLALIESFPQDPQSASNTVTAAPSMDASVEKDESARPHQRHAVMACLSSLACHVAVIAILVVGFVVTPHDPVEEAGEVVSVIILGDSEADQAAAGEKAEEPPPEEIVAETVQTQTVQPTAMMPTETEPKEPVAVAPAQEVTRVSPENVVAAQSEVLTSLSPAETSVVQPMATEVPPEVPAETPPVAQAAPQEVKPVQPMETAAVAPQPDKPTLEPKPKAQKPVKKPVEKKEPPKKAKPSAGSGGENKQDSKKGLVDGTETATSSQNSRGAGNSGGAGSAVVANYPGKVRSRVLRALRVPSALKREPASVSLSLTIVSSGALSSVRVARSSGNPQLDQVTVDAVHRAAPFQPLPAGKPAWSFTLPFQVGGR
ncbi:MULTISPECIES: TonB family protein [Rhizobium]|uniref:Myosin-IXb Unconventional myosin-9b n=1 Tax=Rhizobium favelukesii TaxID=348824 RepID=W6RIU6_9HYPH|nr:MULTISPECIES: TonB family protein [Rhizobium]MCS0462960.1 TonB family protein [Rhizobium favelukesii]UFS83603.1 TonB family protein [Rhizobium sp. T136]CDM58793.1 Myosin-IXb Unconventional myosin-9b [Rhizobium favelukesii]